MQTRMGEKDIYRLHAYQKDIDREAEGCKCTEGGSRRYSHHYLMETKLKVKKCFEEGGGRREVMRRGMEVIKAGELGKQESKKRLQEKTEGKWSTVKGRDEGGGSCKKNGHF